VSVLLLLSSSTFNEITINFIFCIIILRLSLKMIMSLKSETCLVCGQPLFIKGTSLVFNVFMDCSVRTSFQKKIPGGVNLM